MPQPALEPTPAVLAAFGLAGPARRLPGGAGHSYRAGPAVLKPADTDPDAADWLARTIDLVDDDEFRVARPLRTTTGTWTHEGWTASRHVAGAEPDHRGAPRWPEIVAAGRALHRALRPLPRPDFLDHRTDWWSTGDRAAWGEPAADVLPPLRTPYERLLAALPLLRPPPDATAQLVHGDLTGNVLFAPGLPPAVIDLSPYWRPPGFASAVVVADAVIWHGAGRDLVERIAEDEDERFVDHVVRAVIYRLVTTSESLAGQKPASGHPAGGPLAADAAGATEVEAQRYAEAAATVTAAATA